VYGTHAIVSSSQPLATQAGLEILKRGGNAADAAVAVAAALNVTEPSSTGIGGDAFCLFYDAKLQTVKAMNGSGRSPAGLTLKYAKETLGFTGSEIPARDLNSVTVPGAAAAWVDTVEKLGSGTVTLEDVLAPAIELAENGFPVSHISANAWKGGEKTLLTASPNYNEMLIDGRAPREGEIMTNPNLAKTFRTLAKEGKEGFYTGRIAQEIVNLIQSGKGVMTLEDLAAHDSQFVEPISIDYEDITVWECPPNGQGIAALIALGVLKELQKQNIVDFSKLEHNSAAYLHTVIEALRIAFADVRHYVADPDRVSVPTKELLSEEYLRERSKLFLPTKTNPEIKKGYPTHNSGTVYFSVVDDYGNACSFINSNYMGFGTAAIPKGCGFVLQNRGANFTLTEGAPNCLGPSKRPYHTIIPSMITRKGTDGSHELVASFGVMGGFMQPQGHLQVVLNLIHYLFNPQHALDVPRICISPPDDEKDSSDPLAYSFTDVSKAIVYVEDGIAEEEVDILRKMGHTCKKLDNYSRGMFGRGQIIQVHQDKRTGKRVLSAGSDPRADGQACGW